MASERKKRAKINNADKTKIIQLVILGIESGKLALSIHDELVKNFDISSALAYKFIRDARAKIAGFLSYEKREELCTQIIAMNFSIFRKAEQREQYKTCAMILGNLQRLLGLDISEILTKDKDKNAVPVIIAKFADEIKGL